ncbi:MAG: hypothetical protein MRZ64_03725 [[Bacteroides] pectinophilus]|nr:hypothetical protein [[Bacteroides] pectinophilus]
MDILKILQESADDLIPEDLDFFETELATGGHYNAAYQAQCKSRIARIRKWMSEDTEETTPPDEEKKAASNGIVIGVQDIAPEGAGAVMPKLSPARQVQSDIKSLRDRTDYKSAFKKYVEESAIIDSDFLDKNFAVFDSWEINAIVSVKQLGEAFLEKYFGAIDHDKIARYQMFSEGFFMKHFAQMDAVIVLKHGKNEWRKKENRSKQLDVFLRLKGVKI